MEAWSIRDKTVRPRFERKQMDQASNARHLHRTIFNDAMFGSGRLPLLPTHYTSTFIPISLHPHQAPSPPFPSFSGSPFKMAGEQGKKSAGTAKNKGNNGKQVCDEEGQDRLGVLGDAS